MTAKLTQEEVNKRTLSNNYELLTPYVDKRHRVDIRCLTCGKVKNVLAGFIIKHNNSQGVCRCNGTYNKLTNDKIIQLFKIWGLTPLEQYKNNRCGKIKTLCHCGEIFYLYIKRFLNGKTTQCKRCNQTSKFQCGDLSTVKLWGCYQRALQNHWEYNLTSEYMWDLFLKQDRKCIYSKELLTTINASVDRINSKNGYIIGNVQWVDKYVNRIKWKLSEEEFLYFTKLVANPLDKLVNNINYDNMLKWSKWSKWKYKAKIRHLDFQITPKYMEKVFIQQNGCCIFTGLPLSFDKVAYINIGTASIDRIDSKKGYIEGNVQWTHKIVNIIKNNLMDNDFISWCKKINQHSNINGEL
jgi:hypothetical protein